MRRTSAIKGMNRKPVTVISGWTIKTELELTPSISPSGWRCQPMPYRLLEDTALNTETLGAKGNFLCTIQLLGFFGPQESESLHLGEQRFSDVTSHKRPQWWSTLSLQPETLGAKGNFLCTFQLLGFFGPQESESLHLGEQRFWCHISQKASVMIHPFSAALQLSDFPGIWLNLPIWEPTSVTFQAGSLSPCAADTLERHL